MSRTRLGFIGSMMAYLGFSPKAPSDPPPPATGAISATSVENYIGGTVTISTIGGSVTGTTPGGSLS
jgi:hypothetical protein